MKKIVSVFFTMSFICVMSLFIFNTAASADTVKDVDGNPVQEYYVYKIKMISTNHTALMHYRHGSWTSTYLCGDPSGGYSEEILSASRDASVGTEVTTDKTYRLGTRVTEENGFTVKYPFYENPSTIDLWGGLYLKPEVDYSCNFDFKNVGNNQYAINTDDGPLFYQPTSGYIVPIHVTHGLEISEPFNVQFIKL